MFDIVCFWVYTRLKKIFDFDIVSLLYFSTISMAKAKRCMGQYECKELEDFQLIQDRYRLAVMDPTSLKFPNPMSWKATNPALSWIFEVP